MESLNQSNAIGFVFPATPQSIQDDEDNKPRVYDLLITSGETVSALVYNRCEANAMGLDPMDEADNS
ncbi:hypothetical protein B9H04_17490 [Halorubrum ezzemoulense DSM 17463]|uniref:Uncharacterized protein n=1 Tax=Halorubrum ezzemoulense DSM 17463 TaxID=1121945 RepID=A0A1X4G4F4_HALEZ|nr:hypothetical protein B9H04_17490 [Halorubrum ezzemoulense DSM 17463]